ncbi:MAG: agmatine deiminase family protein [Gammaproteobacteria bacterium]|nr:agmatine deiminase family protein [Gammaproteobacteria bacterium]
MPGVRGVPHWPAEWSRQAAVILTWPHSRSDWAERLALVEPVFIAIVKAIADYESVIVNCLNEAHRQQVHHLLQINQVNLAAVQLWVIETNDTWVRDYGPLSLRDQHGDYLLDFRFNGWGGKYPSTLDDTVSQRLHAQGGLGNLPLHTSAVILEGGAIDTDGQGSVLTTERCLLSPRRNPSMTKTDYQQLFKTRLGIERVFWLSHGELQGDDTDGHIDMLARFCDATTLAYVQCSDQQDDHYPSLTKMRQELEQLRTPTATPYTLIPLPLPRAKYSHAGRRLPASYANFLIINGALLVPTYNDPADAIALENLQSCFPARNIIGIDCLPIIEQNGSLHCLTMQLAALNAA